MRFGILGLITALAFTAPAMSKPRETPPPAAAAGPEAFVRWVYGRYATNDTFDNDTQYSPSLRALFAINTRLADGVTENNEIDEICQCQDWDHLRITALHVSPVVAGRTNAKVVFVNGASHEALTLKLLLTPVGWRVDDVIHPKPDRSASLRARLVDENRRMAPGKP
jgi:hypothetical protein